MARLESHRSHVRDVQRQHGTPPAGPALYWSVSNIRGGALRLRGAHPGDRVPVSEFQLLGEGEHGIENGPVLLDGPGDLTALPRAARTAAATLGSRPRCRAECRDCRIAEPLGEEPAECGETQRVGYPLRGRQALHLHPPDDGPPRGRGVRPEEAHRVAASRRSGSPWAPWAHPGLRAPRQVHGRTTPRPRPEHAENLHAESRHIPPVLRRGARRSGGERHSARERGHLPRVAAGPSWQHAAMRSGRPPDRPEGPGRSQCRVRLRRGVGTQRREPGRQGERPEGGGAPPHHVGHRPVRGFARGLRGASHAVAVRHDVGRGRAAVRLRGPSPSVGDVDLGRKGSCGSPAAGMGTGPRAGRAAGCP